MMTLAAINEKEESALHQMSIEFLLEEEPTIHEKALIVILCGKIFTLQTKSNKYLTLLNEVLVVRNYPYAHQLIGSLSMLLQFRI